MKDYSIKEVSSEKQINYQFKILYAIGIIFVVAGHCNGGSFSFLSNWFPFYSFHLALFVFASGYFYNEKSEDAVFKYILKKIKRLLIPMYIWNIIYGILVYILKYKGGGLLIGGDFNINNLIIEPLLTGHQFIYNLGGWFIVPLFCVEIFHIIFKKILKILIQENSKYTEYIILFTYFCIGIFGEYLSNLGYNYGWYLPILRMMCFLPFYALGILYHKKLEKYDTINNWIYFAFLFIVQLFIITKLGEAPTYEQAWCKSYTNGYLTPYIVGILGIAFWLRISKIIVPILKESKLILIIANNTYAIMLHQFLGFMFIKTIFAFICSVTRYCQDFDWLHYKTNIWYYYYPRGISQYAILYLISGITIPIIIYYIQSYLLNKIRKLISNRLNH